MSIGVIFTLIGAHPTAAFMDLIAAHNISFEQAAAVRQHDGGEHNGVKLPCSRRASHAGRWPDPLILAKNFDQQSPITTPRRAAGAVGLQRTRIAHLDALRSNPWVASSSQAHRPDLA